MWRWGTGRGGRGALETPVVAQCDEAGVGLAVAGGLVLELVLAGGLSLVLELVLAGGLGLVHTDISWLSNWLRVIQLLVYISGYCLIKCFLTSGPVILMQDNYFRLGGRNKKGNHRYMV
ncbi:uncharacterized protein [Aegilops tauschii subsp. strangulata]|uniref:uncharacterized protein n=1 Tax=Aegilops tauschii subsp. strangulata TaxID=200361 RepID=UPI00098B1D56|nr:uncharacterized protein LOC109764891 [Aegilops tauschii subsp. strangulata]